MNKLHIICGACGCNTMFEYKPVKDIDDKTNKKILKVYIICNNCSTVFDLDDYAKK